MKTKDITIGETYIAKVSGNLVPVKVLREREVFGFGCPNGRRVWDCVNTKTGRSITVRSSQRFRYPAKPPYTGDLS